MNELFITGAGISALSGIPTFRGEDGYWTIGSENYTPMEMATRDMYCDKPAEFLKWYYKRFIAYSNCEPNPVHHWLADKNLITQNIDGLDFKAGNQDYIAVHGRMDLMTIFHKQGDPVELIKAPWHQVDEDNLEESLLELFQIENHKPKIYLSYKPFVLLFDEYYTELYRINEALDRMRDADKMIFMGTSFSVNITQMALETAMRFSIPIEVVDPKPAQLLYENVTYHEMDAIDYIASRS